MRIWILLFGALLALALQGCTSTPPLAASGAQAYELMPPAPIGNNAPRADYQIGPLDTLSISVFQEESLSREDVPVDASGNIIYPLIGQLRVNGLTAQQVGDTIASRLDARFLVNPQVSVLVRTSVSQKVTVDGEVEQPGVYPLQGLTSLVQSIAMAKGVTDTAKLDEVLVFRTIGTTRYAARFNLQDIRQGRALDPEIRADDIVVVGYSRAKSIFRDVLTAAPALSAGFVAITQIAQ